MTDFDALAAGLRARAGGSPKDQAAVVHLLAASAGRLIGQEEVPRA